MAIQMKRQGGGASNNATATTPTALAYGEIGIDSAGNIYCGNGKTQVTSQVKNAANVLFLYKGTYKKDGWTADSVNGTWSQTVMITAQDGGPAIKADFTLSAPMAAQTDNRTTNEQRQDALGTIAAGKCTQMIVVKLLVQYLKSRQQTLMFIGMRAYRAVTIQWLVRKVLVLLLIQP